MRSSTIASYSIILLNCAIVDMIGAACSLFSMPRYVCPFYFFLVQRLYYSMWKIQHGLHLQGSLSSWKDNIHLPWPVYYAGQSKTLYNIFSYALSMNEYRIRNSVIMEQMYANSTFLLTFSFAFRLFVLKNASEPKRSVCSVFLLKTIFNDQTVWIVSILLWIPNTLSTVR